MASHLAVSVSVAAPASSPSPVVAAAASRPSVALRRGLPPTCRALRARPSSRGAAVVCQAQGSQDTAIQGKLVLVLVTLLSPCFQAAGYVSI